MGDLPLTCPATAMVDLPTEAYPMIPDPVTSDLTWRSSTVVVSSLRNLAAGVRPRSCMTQKVKSRALFCVKKKIFKCQDRKSVV